jgi:hypothetical protein
MGRENRLYQADWLMRLYGYSLEEVIRPEQPYLDLQTDPKLGFAQRQPDLFPVDINSAEYDMILRVPGIGLRSAKRIVRLRRQGLIRYEHLRQMGVALNRAVHFIVCPGQPVLRRAVKDKEDRPVGVADLPRRKLSVAVPSTSDRQLVFLTDGTFEGLLTAVFEAYAGRTDPAQIRSRKVHRRGSSRKVWGFQVTHERPRECGKALIAIWVRTADRSFIKPTGPENRRWRS